MSKQDLEVLKEFQDREKSDRFCCTCGKAISKNRASTTSYCSLCTYIKRYGFEHRKKPPIKTDAGFYLIIDSKICEADCDKLHCLGYFHKEQGYLYINLRGIEKRIDFIPKLLFVINHEAFHYFINEIDEHASTLLDSPFARYALDDIHGEVSIYTNMEKEERRKRFIKWVTKLLER